MKAVALLTVILVTSFSTKASAQGYGYYTGSNSLGVRVSASSSNMGAHREEFGEEVGRAKQSREEYETYRDRVSAYIAQVEQVCEQAHQQRPDIEAKLAKIKRELGSMSVDDKSQAKQQISEINNWLASEAALSSQAARNIDLCQRYLAHARDEANIAAYNAAEEEQAIVDEERKLREAQQMIASEQRKAQEAAYWENQNNDYYGGYGYGGYRHGGRGYAHIGGHHSGGGGGFAHVHSSGGAMHVGGHGGHR